MPLSIIIPCHRRTDLLAACLRSVLAHAPQGTEILVVDDASPAAAVAHLATSFPGVKTLRLSRRQGFCGAVNAGIAAALHPFLELLNDDTEVQAGWTEAPLHRLQDAKVAAVAPLVLQWPHGQRIDSAGDTYYLGGVARKRGHGQPLSEKYLRPGQVFSASGCGAFYRKEALQAIGGFPEVFGAYFEDVDVGFRLRRAGGEIWYEPSSRILHHGSASYGKKPPRRLLELQSRNEELVFWRNVPASLMTRALPKHAAVLAGKALRRWQEGNFLPFLAGRLRAWADLPAWWQERKASVEIAELDIRWEG
jgi:GT2 family glycosyltransferase